jgi:16S rRNA processing protein RimM
MARLEVGRVVKPHGLAGEVVVKFTSNRPERAATGARFDVVLAQGGAERSLEIESVRPSGAVHLVRFAGVEGRDGAESLRGAVLLAEELHDAEALFIHDLIGLDVFDTSGERKGSVTGVEANPASDLLVIDDRFYVPMRFVVQASAHRIVVDVPPGLFE